MSDNAVRVQKFFIAIITFIMPFSFCGRILRNCRDIIVRKSFLVIAYQYPIPVFRVWHIFVARNPKTEPGQYLPEYLTHTFSCLVALP